MDGNKIVYDSDEISNIMSKIGNNTSIIENEIMTSISNDFSILKELDLFGEGLDKLNSNANKIVSLNNRLSSKLNEHDSSMNELNKKHLNLFNNDDNYSGESSVYNGEVIEIDEINLDNITDGKIILNEYIGSVIFKFSYNRKLALLKKILNNGDSSLDIITDSEQSDILIYRLKEILKEDYSIDLGKISKEEEKEIQKAFFDAIRDDKKNIFDEIEEDSILHGLAYFEEVSNENNISVSSLLYDDNNKELFVKALKDIYDNHSSSLTDKEISSVKNYIDTIATTNNIEASILLSGGDYSSVLKGGIFYES